MLSQTLFQRFTPYGSKPVLGQSFSQKGRYLDKRTGREVFIKTSTDREAIEYEFAWQLFFYNKATRLKSEIIVPKPLEILHLESSTALVAEYLPAKPIQTINYERRAQIYISVLSFLRAVNDTTKNVGIKVKEDSMLYLLAVLPYFLLKNIILYPSLTGIFLLSFWKIIRSSRKLMKVRSRWICHGDINITNIMLLNNKIVLVDFARARLSHEYADLSRALNSTWFQPDFQELFWKSAVKKLRLGTRAKLLVQILALFNLMERLTTRYQKVEQEKFYCEKLQKIEVKV